MKNLIRAFLKNLTSAMGVFWLILKLLEFFFPPIIPWLTWGWTLVFIFLASGGYAAFTVWPWRTIRLRIAGTDAHIALRFGDILDAGGNIAMASSNFFNTDLNFRT